MKKTLIILTALLLFTNCFSQEFKNYELKRLESFGLNAKPNEPSNLINYLNFDAILEKDKERRTKKTLGIVFTSLSALTTAFGVMVISGSKNDQEGVGESIGSMFVGIGVIELGVSIPLFLSSNKRKNERDRLIEIYKYKAKLN
jgi:hypothetical protein